MNGAIIYDFSARNNAVIPDAALGRAALANAVGGVVPVGRVGAGVAATVGKIDWSRAEFAGQGAAFREVAGIKVLVVNAVGVIVDREQQVIRGNYDPATGERRHPSVDYATAFAAHSSALAPGRSGTRGGVDPVVARGHVDVDVAALDDDVCRFEPFDGLSVVRWCSSGRCVGTIWEDLRQIL